MRAGVGHVRAGTVVEVVVVGELVVVDVVGDPACLRGAQAAPGALMASCHEVDEPSGYVDDPGRVDPPDRRSGRSDDVGLLGIRSHLDVSAHPPVDLNDDLDRLGVQHASVGSGPGAGVDAEA